MAKPTLLLTRPRDAAQNFAQSLDQDALAAVRLIISPLLEIVPTGVVPEIADHQSVIFTSANGALQAPGGKGRHAYCVGVQTTRTAAARGWSAEQSGENAQELIKALCAKAIAGPLIHLGGAHTRGDIAQTLTAAGIQTHHIILYDQRLLGLTSEALDALETPCIIPVYSPRTAQQLADQAQGRLGKAHIVALSPAVAAPLATEIVADLLIFPAARAQYMRKAVENLCLSLT